MQANRPSRELGVRVGLVLASLLVGLVLAEIAVRALDLAPPIALIQAGRYRLSANPKIGYEPAPLEYHGDEADFYDYKGASNRLGFRDVDHEVAKPDGVYRIILIGDSIGAALKIARFEDMFAQVIVSVLRSQGFEVELINLSVSGYNTQQEVETLKERGLQYDPDLVLLQYCLNDRRLQNGDLLEKLLRQEMQEPRISAVRLQPLLLRSELFRFLRFRVLPHRPPTRAEQASLHRAVEGDTVAESLDELKRLSDEHGFDLLALIFPTLQSFDPYVDEASHRWVQAHLDRLEIPALDLLEDMRRCASATRAPIAYDYLHPNELGHRCAGRAIAREVAKRLPPWARQGD